MAKKGGKKRHHGGKRNKNKSQRTSQGRNTAAHAFNERYPDFRPGLMRIKTSYGFVDPAACEERFKGWRMPLRTMRYHMRSPGKNRQVRGEFRDAKKEFLAHIVEHCSEELKALGVTYKQMQVMSEKGRSPVGFNVHHKLPIGGGGTNDFANLCFIRNDPFHQEIHKHLDTQLIDMNVGESRQVAIAWPEGMVFVPSGYTPPKKRRKRKNNAERRDHDIMTYHGCDIDMNGRR
ncbi:MAG: hypothetical protein Alpg2KO_33300 [Alphaproteobacteria bacterium]